MKRRVYDALNVLISADILVKKDKYVLSKFDSFYCGNNKKFKPENILEIQVYLLSRSKKNKLFKARLIKFKYW